MPEHTTLSTRCAADLQRLVQQHAASRKQYQQERQKNQETHDKNRGTRPSTTAGRLKAYQVPTDWCEASSLATKERSLLRALPRRLEEEDLASTANTATSKPSATTNASCATLPPLQKKKNSNEHPQRKHKERRGCARNVVDKLKPEELQFLFDYANYRQNKALRGSTGVERGTLQQYTEAFESYMQRPPDAHELQEAKRLRWQKRPPWTFNTPKDSVSPQRFSRER